MNKAKCDICNAAINEPDGYLLTTTQVVRSPRFWLDYYRRHQGELAAMDIPSYDTFLNSSACTTMTERVAQDGTPWLVCEQCVHLFEVDQKQAWVYAHHWWESRGAFTPPDTGPAPLSAIKMEEMEETVPTPAPEKRERRKARPPRGVPRWPPVVALLNLNGLGLGYLYIKRWLRWLVHFLLTPGLVALVFVTKGDHFPALGVVVLGLWLLWMAFDGWWQARRLVRATPAGTIGCAWLPLASSVFLLALMLGVLGGYFALGQREFAAGMAAYEEADCRSAMQRFNRVTTLYELTLSPNVAAADARIVECSLLLFAANTRGQGEYATAIDGYETYLHLYPKGALTAFARDTLAETYGDWAAQLRQIADYQTAVEKYQIVLNDYPETPTGGHAATLAAETYGEWAAQLREAGEYEEAIQKYQTILNEYPDTPASEQATPLSAEIYGEWAAHLRQEGEYEQAIAGYQTLLGEYADTPAAAGAGDAAAETYVEWAVQLRASGDYQEAVQKYQTVISEYPAAPAAHELDEAVSQTYAEWAAQLRETGLYIVAIGKYKTILDDYPRTQPAATAQVEIAQTYNEWGRQLHSQRQYIEAMDKFQLAQEASDDPAVISAAEEGYDQALWGLSQDITGEGKQVMSQALADVCAGDPAASPAVGLAEDEAGKALFGGSGFTLPANLKATRPGHFRYAICMETGTSVLQRCSYTGGHTLVRQRRWWRVSARDTRTARIVADRTFYGSSPGSCPLTHFFSGTVDYTTGGSPSTDQIISWLQGVVR